MSLILNDIFYVYLHTRNDTGEIFYVGKGKKDRAQSKRGRNTYWNRIVKKAGGFTATFAAIKLSESEAYLLEKKLIKHYRGSGLNLVNLTDGGDGASGEKNYFFGRRFCGSDNVMYGKKRPDVSEYNKTRTNPLKGKRGALSKTSKPLWVEFEDGVLVYSASGAEEFARSIRMPTGSMSYCLSTGKPSKKFGIARAWRV